MKESLEFIYKQQKELSVFGGIASLLGWDQMTYMPQGGAEDRSEHISLISTLAHEKVISDTFWKHIEKLTNNIESLSEKDQIVIKRLRKDVENSRKIPSEFVEKLSKTTTIAYPAWQKARERANYSLFSAHLKRIVDLQKEYCEYINLPGHSYNSLLDGFEEGMTVKKLKPELSFLKNELVKIINKIKESKCYKNQKKYDFTFDKEKQKKLCNFLIKKMNISDIRARYDVSTHPFTTQIGYDDVRITTNFERSDPLFSFFSTVHEAGHALYDLNILKGEFKDTVISDAASVGLHESQSRFWENMIAHSYDFWKFFYPYFQKNFSDYLNKISLDDWYFYINRVGLNPIRIEADELTYSLHVILRFELELDLITDEIKVEELSNHWNEKMNNLLDITPRNDKEGVLQDMHWSTGQFGYFPTYIIGSIYSSQLFNALSKQNTNIKSDIQNGNFEKILKWLIENVHKHGRLLNADEIIKKSCGEGLNSKIFIDYLKNKFFEIYQV